MELTPSVQHTLDRQAITDLLYKYCRAVDRLDIELGHSIWHEGATADYGDIYKGDGKGVIDTICAYHRNMLAHAHHLSNISLDIDGDRAGSETYVTAALRLAKADGEAQITIWARYVDEWSCRDGRWGITKRTTIVDFDEIRDVTAVTKSDRSRRDRNDPSYSVLQVAT